MKNRVVVVVCVVLMLCVSIAWAGRDGKPDLLSFRGEKWGGSVESVVRRNPGLSRDRSMSMGADILVTYSLAGGDTLYGTHVKVQYGFIGGKLVFGSYSGLGIILHEESIATMISDKYGVRPELGEKDDCGNYENVWRFYSGAVIQCGRGGSTKLRKGTPEYQYNERLRANGDQWATDIDISRSYGYLMYRSSDYSQRYREKEQEEMDDVKKKL